MRKMESGISTNDKVETRGKDNVVTISIDAKDKVKIILSYYTPYHSKYNKIERVWGSLEQHWNISILNTKEAVLYFAKSMT